MGDKNILIWLLLGAVFAGAAWWHVRENRQLARKWRGDFDADSAERLVRFAWSRTVQLLVALACATVAIIAYDRQLNQSHQELGAAHKPAEAHPQPQQNAARKPQPLQNRVAPVQPKVAAQPAAPVIPHVADSYYPPLVAQPPVATRPVPAVTQPAPARAVPVQTPPPVQAPLSAVPPAVPNKTPLVVQAAANSEAADEPDEQPSAIGAIGSPYDNPQTVDDVYNPEKKSGGNESAMDAIKKRYEDILVTYMYLKQCSKIGEGDYPIIISALAQEMASVNAPGRMQYDIITSAQGSYKEMYAHSSCSGADVNALSAQYADYIKGLSKNVASP